MRRYAAPVRWSFFLCAFAAIVGPSVAAGHGAPPQARQQAQAVVEAATEASADPEPLTLADYPRWSRIGEVEISPDGRWMTYAYEPNEGDSSFFVRQLDGETVHQAQNGSGPGFSNDSRWVAYLVSPPESETERDRERGPVVRELELIDLASGDRQEFSDVASFEFAESSRFLAIQKNRADRDAEHQGADLLVRHLANGTTLNLGNVDEHAFNEVGELLAYTVDAADKAGNGVYVMAPDSGRIRPLDTATERYARLTWSDDGTRLAVLRGEDEEGFEQRANTLLVFEGLGQAGEAGGGTDAETAGTQAEAAGVRTISYDPRQNASFPADMVLSELGEISFSDDGSRVFVGIKEQREEIEENDDDEDRADVDVWHWKDEQVQSVQRVRAAQNQRFTYRSLVVLPEQGGSGSPRFLRLAEERMRSVTPAPNGLWALGRDDSETRGDMSVAGGAADYFHVDTATGEKTLMADDIRYAMGTSPDSEWFLYLEGGDVKARHVASGEVTNLSQIAGVDFVDQSFDRPTEKSTYGLAGWSADGSSVILNHEFDLWVVPLRPDAGNGSNGADRALNLTAGMGDREQIRFRYVDPEAGPRRGGFGGGGGTADDEGIDLSQPLVLSAYGEWTKKSGYFQVMMGDVPEPVVFVDAMIGDVRRAAEADRMIFTRQTIVEFPDYWTGTAVSADGFAQATKITDANPQQADYLWTPGRILIDYTDSRGHDLQATLTLPAGYEEGRRYPMLVYFYEKMSQRHHQYSVPVYDDRPHMSTYASNGYLVLMPDIIYDDGKPGSSALDDVSAAVREVIDRGYADPERIGLQGHSWGGYESSYIVTQTDLFACVVTGAPLTNLVSMHNILYKRTGGPNAPLIQWGQGRMAASPWDDLQAYVDQSPVHNAEGISTPFMILHGTEDGAVDWNQGLEFYIAAKRLGKEVILLSYPGEPHHLGEEANQKDFQIRMMQYFDHYLKGEPAPRWLADGIPYLDKGREQIQ